MTEKIESKTVGALFRVQPTNDVKIIEGDDTCDVCGLSMTDDENREFVGISFELSRHPEAERVLKTFGKQTFKICFVCWLKSLGVKET